MNSTKRLISDQVLYRIYGGPPDSSAPIKEEDVWKALEQKINSLFQLKHFDTTLPSGETIPDNLSIAIYENIPVLSYSMLKSKALLPVIPISLPRAMGIYSVYDPNFPDFPFIPIQRGQRALLQTDSLLGDLMGFISYEPVRNAIIFDKDLPSVGVSAVTMELVVMDVSSYGVDDPLPIPANYEMQIVQELVVMFSPVTPETGEVNNYSIAGQNQIKQ